MRHKDPYAKNRRFPNQPPDPFGGWEHRQPGGNGGGMTRLLEQVKGLLSRLLGGAGGGEDDEGGGRRRSGQSIQSGSVQAGKRRREKRSQARGQMASADDDEKLDEILLKLDDLMDALVKVPDDTLTVFKKDPGD